MPKFFSLVATAFWIAMSSGAQAADLIQVYRLAKDNDPRFRAAQFDHFAAEQVVPQARANLLPNVSLSAEHIDSRQRIRTSQNPVFGTGLTDFPTDTYTLTIVQPLVRKSAWDRLAQAHAGAKQAHASMIAAEQHLMLRASIAYFAVLAA